MTHLPIGRALLALVLVLALPACRSLMCQIDAGPHADEWDIRECEQKAEAQAEAEREERARLAWIAGQERACLRGEPDACDLTASWREDRGQYDLVTLERYELACRSSSVVRVHACFRGALLLVNLHIDLPDPSRMFDLLERSCRLLEGEACALLSNRVASPADRLHYAEEACEMHYLSSCIDAGWMRVNGAGGARDLVAARRHFAAACRGGWQGACAALEDPRTRDP